MTHWRKLQSCDSVGGVTCGAFNKEFLYHRLEETSPERSTNLSAGLLEAFAQNRHNSDAAFRPVMKEIDSIPKAP